jgi:Tfp pilus assembly ATPase PilU
MDDALAELHQRGLISAEEALTRAEHKQEMREQLRK